MNKAKELLTALYKGEKLKTEEYKLIIEHHSKENAEFAQDLAVKAREEVYGRDVYIRGLIEISNHCKNNCLYCGIRRENKHCERYRLSKEDIMLCCEKGYKLGFRTFVLQGGEDPYFTDERLLGLVSGIKKKHPDCAITLSLGERDKESYKALFNEGADRYLLRHETADREHYNMLHPSDMSFEKRMECLCNLKEIGFAVGCGFMVGSPGQTASTLAKDLKFIEEFSPQMCGIGPFITHKDTPFKNQKSGSVHMTLYLLSVIRLIKPTLLLPATTALGSLCEKGREMGILAGANVIMPNLSPHNVRKKYEIYDGKLYSGEEAAESLDKLKESINRIGYNITVSRGDPKTV